MSGVRKELLLKKSSLLEKFFYSDSSEPLLAILPGEMTFVSKSETESAYFITHIMCVLRMRDSGRKKTSIDILK